MTRDQDQADRDTTGVGTPRSAGIDSRGTNAEVDPAVTVGATTSSHPANADDVNINRSGSGGTGGAGDDSDDSGGGGAKD